MYALDTHSAAASEVACVEAAAASYNAEGVEKHGGDSRDAQHSCDRESESVAMHAHCVQVLHRYRQATGLESCTT
jgi:hypothetical protein